MNCSTPGLPVHHQFPEFTQTHVHPVSDAIQPSHPRSSPSPPAPNPSQHKSFSNESALRMRWPKYWSFSFSIIPSKEIAGLISFRMDWLDLFAVQGTLRSLQHHSSSSVTWCNNRLSWMYSLGLIFSSIYYISLSSSFFSFRQIFLVNCPSFMLKFSFLAPTITFILVKNPPANAGDIRDMVWSLCWEDPLK